MPYQLQFASKTNLVLPKLDRFLRIFTNRERQRRAVRTLQDHKSLCDAAIFHSINMARSGFFDHLDPQGRTPGDRLAVLHPEMLASVAENLAKYSLEGTEEDLARAIVEGLMNSPGHRANILKLEFSHIGLGCVQAGGYVYATQVFASPLIELVSPHAPILTRDKSPTLRFVYHGSHHQELELVLDLPDSSAKVFVSGYQYILGSSPQVAEWEGPRAFRLRPALKYGPGDYKLRPGFGGKYTTTAVDIVLLN